MSGAILLRREVYLLLIGLYICMYERALLGRGSYRTSVTELILKESRWSASRLLRQYARRRRRLEQKNGAHRARAQRQLQTGYVSAAKPARVSKRVLGALGDGEICKEGDRGGLEAYKGRQKALEKNPKNPVAEPKHFALSSFDNNTM